LDCVFHSASRRFYAGEQRRFPALSHVSGDLQMAFTIKPANFSGRNPGEMVPWVVVDSGDCPGAKRGKSGQGINPRLILSILGDDPSSDNKHQAHLRSVSLRAIAMTQPAPDSPLIKKAVTKATHDLFYGWDGANVLPLMPRAEAVKLAASNPDAMFSIPSDKNEWREGAFFGLLEDTPPPPAPPVAPKPEVASGEDVLAKIQAARGNRVLSR